MYNDIKKLYDIMGNQSWWIDGWMDRWKETNKIRRLENLLTLDR